MALSRPIPSEKRTTSSKLIQKFLQNISLRNINTANEYFSRLLIFEDFLNKQFKLNTDTVIENILSHKLNPYVVLNDYCFYLTTNHILSPTAFRDKIITTKNFLEYNDVEISPKKFKLKIRFPKIILRNKEAIDKNDIIKILNGISDLRLKTYVMLLASTGLRATEALSIRVKDLDLESNNTSKLTIRGEYTKTRTERFVFLTREMNNQIKLWLDYKHRKRRVSFKDKKTGKTINEYRIPINNNPNEFIFSDRKKSKVDNLYVSFASSFAKTLDRIGMGNREDENERRRKITLHSFRRFVKTTISDLGYSDYSEWFIGHSGSTYWRKKDSEKAELFKKIESYLTFLNFPQLERQGADLQTRVEELQMINQSLRENDRVKEDALAHLSDQLLILTERIQQLENRQIH